MNKPNQLSWEYVLSRKDLLGGDIEISAPSTSSRGPLISISIDCNVVIFKTAWWAKFCSESRSWKVYGNELLYLSTTVTPTDGDSGRIFFHVPFLGTCTMYPYGDISLPSTSVLGLPKPPDRLLALFPDLMFNRDIAENLLMSDDWQFLDESRGQIVLKLRSHSISFRDLLESLGEVWCIEEFFKKYVKAVTGKDISLKAY